MTAPSIKEALEYIVRNAYNEGFNEGMNEVTRRVNGGKSWFDVQAKYEAKLAAALVTFQPDGERREAIARLAKRFWSIHPREIQDMGITREQFYEREMTKLHASGLVQDEAGIRADEREKLRNRLDSHLNDFLCGMKEGWDDSVSGFNDAWDVVRKVFDAAAIRSARNRGAET